MNSPTAASPPSLPSLSAKWEREHENRVSFSPFYDVRAAVSAPRWRLRRCAPWPSGLSPQLQAFLSASAAEDQTPLRLHYRWKTSACVRDWWEEKRATSPAAPRCLLYRRVSLAWRFMSKPARDEGLMQLLEVFMSYESFWL